ncbi:MAG: DUF2330 domain-containing protein [Myxococcota bacterium]
MNRWLVGTGILGIALAMTPATAEACGGFFCNGTPAGPTPVVQAAERVMFEDLGDGMIRAYVQIQYTQQGGVPIGFSWVIPVTSVPELGVADTATFDQLDQATAPQFRFINAPNTGGGGGGGGVGCAASDGSFARGAPAEDGGVRVWEESRVGDYQTAIIEGDDGEAILQWLADNGYDIPAAAENTIDDYVFTGHLFAAFRYDPIGPGSGALPPVVLTYGGLKPCVPIKITAIASMPVLDVMVLGFGAGRARPDPEGEYIETVPNYDAIRVDFTAPTQTTYADEVDAAIEDAGRHAWVVEHASSTGDLGGITDPEAQAILARNPYVTRFYTRLTPEQMDVDPEFVFSNEAEDVNRLHVIDLGARTSGLLTSDETRFAGPPPLVMLMGGAMLAIVWRRRRRLA